MVLVLPAGSSGDANSTTAAVELAVQVRQVSDIDGYGRFSKRLRGTTRASEPGGRPGP